MAGRSGPRPSVTRDAGLHHMHAFLGDVCVPAVDHLRIGLPFQCERWRSSSILGSRLSCGPRECPCPLCIFP